MFKRFALNFVLIFLFAFAQIGATTHEISHIDDLTSHSQQNKKSHSEQCAQCLSFAQIGSGAQTQPFVFHLETATFSVAAYQPSSHSSLTHAAYAARAPPQLHSL